MQRALFVVPAMLFAGLALAQASDRPSALDPKAKSPAVEFRSAFEGYRPFADQEQRDWRKANEEVREAGGHAGHKPGQGASAPSPKPRPGEHPAHGAHK